MIAANSKRFLQAVAADHPSEMQPKVLRAVPCSTKMQRRGYL